MKSKPHFWTHAQGLVEFALILPVLLLLILGVVEMGRLLAIYSGISSGARQAVRYGSVAGDSDPATSGTQSYYLDCSGMRATARQASPLLTLTDDEIVIGYDHGTAGNFASCPETSAHVNTYIEGATKVTSGDRVVIAITTNYRPLVPIVPIPELPLTFMAARTIFTSIIGPTPTPSCPSGSTNTGSNNFSSIASSFTSQTVGSTATINVTIKNSNNCVPTAGVPVLMNGGGATVITPSVTTNGSSGIATFVVTTTVAGVYTFTATANTGVNKTLPITFTAGSVYSGTSTVVASPITVTVDGLATSNVVVTLKDKYGNNVGAGKTVSLASSRSSDVINPLTFGTSNSSGQVTFKVKAAFGSTGTSVYTATATSPATSPAVVIAQHPSVAYTTGGVSPAASTVVAQYSSLTANNSATSLITVTLRDQSSLPISGQSVTLTSDRGGADTITPASVTTNASGQAVFTVRSGTVGTSTYTAHAGALDLDQNSSLTPSITYVVGAVVPGNSTITASPTTVQADGASTSSIVVTLKDASGHLVPGQNVTIISSRGVLDTIAPPTNTSDGSGLAIFTVKSSTVGTSVYTATVSTGNIASATVVFGGATAANSTFTASPTSVQADGASTSTLLVTLKDGAGNPVANKTVVITSTRGITDTIAPASAVTNASGQASFTVKSSTVGTSTYWATDTNDGVTVAQHPSVDFVCVTGTALGITSGSDQFIQIFFTNGTGMTRRLSGLTITWPDSPTSRQLNTAHLENILIWTGSGNNTSPITLSDTSTPAWDATGNRIINNGFSKTLKLTYNFAVSSSGNFVVVASWDNNAGGSICTTPTMVVTP